MTNESQYINSVCRAIAIIELFFKLQVKQLGCPKSVKNLQFIRQRLLEF